MTMSVLSACVRIAYPDRVAALTVSSLPHPGENSAREAKHLRSACRACDEMLWVPDVFAKTSDCRSEPDNAPVLDG